MEEKRRVHHSYMWLGSLRTVGVILFATAISMGSSIIGVIAEGEMNTPEGARMALIIFGLCALLVLLIIGLVVAYQVISYKHLYYQLTPTEFNLYKGIFSKKHVHVPYQRIQSVDQNASLLQRIAGVCTVTIDTAGGSSNKAVMIPYITKQDAESLRVELFARKKYVAAVSAGIDPAAAAAAAAAVAALSQAPHASQTGEGDSNLLDVPADVWEQFNGVFGGDAVDTGAVSFEYGLSNKELVLTGLSNSTAFALIVIAVAGLIGQVVDAAFTFAPSASEHMVDAVVMSAGSKMFAGAVFAGVSSLIGVVAFVWLVSAAGSCISYGGFKARRRGSRIEVERGLLQHRFQGVDVDRVQSVTIRQSFIRRLMGYCEISVGKIDAATDGGDGSDQASQQHGMVLHPFVRVDRVAEILAGIIPEYGDVPSEVRPLAPSALRRGIVRRCIIQGLGFWLIVIVAIGHVAMHVLAASSAVDPASSANMAAALPFIDKGALLIYLLGLVLMVLEIVGAVMWARESSFGVNERFMQVSNGGLSRESVSFLRRKIQYGYAKANPLQRRARTATISARTAAGVGGTTVRLIDVREEDAAEWLVWLKPRVK